MIVYIDFEIERHLDGRNLLWCFRQVFAPVWRYCGQGGSFQHISDYPV